MPRKNAYILRIYCICGQKMKVSDDMLGRPGKCIACSQKIRIPTRGEIADDTNEVHLKDHPEFLRRTRRKSSPRGKSAREKAEEKHSVLGDEKDRVDTTPIDVLDPLKHLCNLVHKADRQLRLLDEIETEPSQDTGRSELKGHLNRIEEARARLDEKLRQQLMETAIELASTREKIAEVGLAARVGEIGYKEYAASLRKLRRRRDNLVRRQINLRGWLKVTDPHLAGGYTSVSFESIPTGEIHVPRLSDMESSEGLLGMHLHGMRQTFEKRGRAERRLSEAKKLEQEGKLPKESLEEIEGDCEAEKKRADSGLSYYYGRFDEMVQDLDFDLQIIQTHLELAKGRMDVGDISQNQYGRIRKELQQARDDTQKARNLAKRVSSVNDLNDLPSAEGPFLKRLAAGRAKAGAADGTKVDAWLTWVAALGLLTSLVLPGLTGSSPIETYQFHGIQAGWQLWQVVGPIATALALSLAALTPLRTVRGVLVCMVWLLGAATSAHFVHEACYHIGRTGDLVRQTGLMQPGILVSAVSLMLAIVAGGIALARDGLYRWVPIGAVACAALFAGTIHTNAFGYFRPIPELNVVSEALAADNEGRYQLGVRIENAGNRPLIIAGNSSHAYAYGLQLKRRVADGEWTGIDQPESVRLIDAAGPMPAGRLQGVALDPGSSAEYVFTVRPGEYRAVLERVSNRQIVAQQATTLTAPPSVVAKQEPAQAGSPPEDQTGASESPHLAEASPEQDGGHTTPPAAAQGQEAGQEERERQAEGANTDAELAGGATPEEAQEETSPPSEEAEATRETEAPNSTVPAAELSGQIAGRMDGAPLFLITLHMPDGTTESGRYSIGDTLHGPWIIQEYDPTRRIVTLNDGESVLILRQGDEIPLTPKP